MPLSSEHIANRPLSGVELIEVMAKDTASLLKSSGHFSSYVAYGRVSYKITVEIDLGNPYLEKQRLELRSRAEGVIELHPLSGDDLAAITVTREREITSPNVARIANNLPIAAQYRDQDGKVVERSLVYDAADLPEQPAPTDTVTVTGEMTEPTARREVKVKD